MATPLCVNSKDPYSFVFFFFLNLQWGCAWECQIKCIFKSNRNISKLTELSKYCDFSAVNSFVLYDNVPSFPLKSIHLFLLWKNAYSGNNVPFYIFQQLCFCAAVIPLFRPSCLTISSFFISALLSSALIRKSNGALLSWGGNSARGLMGTLLHTGRLEIRNWETKHTHWAGEKGGKKACLKHINVCQKAKVGKWVWNALKCYFCVIINRCCWTVRA